jgi:hypothetical protein
MQKPASTVCLLMISCYWLANITQMTTRLIVERVKVAFKQPCKAITVIWRYNRDPQQQPNNMRKISLKIYRNSYTGLWQTWQPSFFHGSVRLHGCWLMPIDLLEQIHVSYTHRLVTLTLPIPTGLLPAGNVAQKCRLDFAFLWKLVKKTGLTRFSLPSSIPTAF